MPPDQLPPRKSKQVFVPRHLPSVGEKGPFNPDRLERRPFGIALMENLADFAGCGGVIVLDAPWGAGKTWFAQNWCELLKGEGFKAHYIDCFSRDYLDDPFVLIASEIVTLAGDGSKKEAIKRGALEVAKSLAPAALRVGGAIAGAFIPGADEFLKPESASKIAEAFSAASEKAIDKYLEERISRAEEDHKAVNHFRDALGNFAKAEAKPVVLIVDELDRCRPSFAVHMIERLKHFFEVPNLVVVLVTALDQLEEYVRGVYGSGVQAERYLRKFYRKSYSLPVQGGTRKTVATSYGATLVSDRPNGYHMNNALEQWEYLSLHCGQMQLRDVEHGLSIYSTFDLDGGWAALFAPLFIYLKLCHPQWYRAIKIGAGDQNDGNQFRRLILPAIEAFSRGHQAEFLKGQYLIALGLLGGWTTRAMNPDEAQLFQGSLDGQPLNSNTMANGAKEAQRIIEASRFP